MEISTISVRVNTEDKKRFEMFCEDIGLNVSSAINLYIKTVLKEKRIPFNIKSDIPFTYEIPNERTALAVAESDRIAQDPSIKGYTNIEDIKAALES